MVEVALAEKAAVTAWNIIKPFAVFIACAAIGFAAAEAWEHRGPGPKVFGIPIFGTSLRAQLTDLRATIPGLQAKAFSWGIAQQAATDKPAFDKWGAALSMCQDTAKQARDTAAAAVSRADHFTSAQADQAYKLGRATCGATNATPPLLGPGPAPAGGVPDRANDFATIFGGAAFTPGAKAAVPPGSDGSTDPGAAAAPGR